MRAANLVLISVVAVLWGCTPSTSVDRPAGWAQIDAKKFTFWVPPDVKAVPTHGIDSYVGQFKGEAIAFGFDYGFYSDPLEYSDRKDFTEKSEWIWGKKAKIVSFHNPRSDHPFDEAIAVHFPDTGTKGIKLTVFATCRTQKDYDTARTIFRTIKFQ